MTDLDELIARLTRLADDATPGDWYVYHELLRPQLSRHKIIEVQSPEADAPVLRWAAFDDADRLKKDHLANAKFIAFCGKHRYLILKALRALEARP